MKPDIIFVKATRAALILCILSMAYIPLLRCNQLDELAIIYSTDKSSTWHNYTEVYDRYLSELREKPINFLEIGFYQGASARMWDTYFTNAQLYFIDNNSDANGHTHGLSNRCRLHILDQANEAALKHFIVATGCYFDVILDDGGHHMIQQIASFKVLFPRLKSNGLYIIEDLHTSYWSAFGGKGSQKNPKAGTGTTINFLFHLINALNYSGARTQCADKKKCPQEINNSMTYYQKEIASMYFYDSLCFIRKR